MTKRLTTEQFNKRCDIIHSGKYDYSLVKYINARSIIIIICNNHGEFHQTSASHLSGRGCFLCGVINNTHTTSDFVYNAKLIHGGKYAYDKVQYITAKHKIIITCNNHGDFNQIPNSHLGGSGCYECGVDARRSTLEHFIIKSNIIHKNKYDYSLVEYNNGSTKIDIICPIHGKFKQGPNDHLSGKGCASCAKSGFDQNKPAYCYYIKFKSEMQTLYKIGVTNLTVIKRLGSMRIDKDIHATIIQELYFENGFEALEMETKILKEFKGFLYQGDPIMKNGNSELFTIDILNLNK